MSSEIQRNSRPDVACKFPAQSAIAQMAAAKKRKLRKPQSSPPLLRILAAVYPVKKHPPQKAAVLNAKARLAGSSPFTRTNDSSRKSSPANKLPAATEKNAVPSQPGTVNRFVLDI